MGLQADLKWIHQELDEVKDETILDVIKNILKYRKKVAQPERISIEHYNKEIDESIAQIEKGELYTHQEVKERMQEWGRQ